ncbi:cell division protein ZapE (plasmid) [Pseudoalteromonas sp. T1lg65]|uniref:cell division protein ZapE n=1 Tax=Pseudoalteromonas sp. T1lg65 TaxID=2077101 RepID=UPI003F7945AF
MSISNHYNKMISNGELSQDLAQQYAVQALDDLLASLATQPVCRGIYLYGRVGRGKTMLMDLFFHLAPTSKKTRLHFHHFMKKVHAELNSIQGVKNPLEHIAKQWAKRTTLLCFDEFFVTDIGDAIIMARLFEALFAAGITLVATSNCHPESLYKNGIHRDRFTPTIALLLAHCQVISVDGDHDHRFAADLQYRHYFINDDDAIKRHFAQNGGTLAPQTLILNNRPVVFSGYGTNVAYFEFESLCTSPRAVEDYIALTERFSVIYINSIPILANKPDTKACTQGIEEGYIRQANNLSERQGDDEARRLIALVDECYEAKTLLIINAAAKIEDIYQGEQLAFAFQRTISRITEMQNW